MEPQSSNVNVGDSVREHLLHNVIRIGITPTEVMDAYSKWAGTYDQDTTKVTYNPPRVAAQEAENVLGANKSARILNLAAGTGLDAVELEKLGFNNIDALDANKEMLERAEEKGLYKNCIRDFLGSNRLDIAESHVNHSCFDELIRITKPGGHIIIVMRARFLELDDFKWTFEPAMQEKQAQGLWDVVARKPFPHYQDDDSGIVFILKVL